MGSPVSCYRHLILLHTQMCDGCKRLPIAREWPAEFGPYTPGYQPRSGKHRDSTQADKGSKPLPKPGEEKETHIATKRRTTVPKHRSILAIRDFLPIPGRFNPYLSNEQKQTMHTQLTQISDEYAQLEQEEIRLLKMGALLEGSDCQRTTFLSSLDKDYEALVKDEEDPSEDSSEE
jgi:hypothetical protein